MFSSLVFNEQILANDHHLSELERTIQTQQILNKELTDHIANTDPSGQIKRGLLKKMMEESSTTKYQENQASIIADHQQLSEEINKLAQLNLHKQALTNELASLTAQLRSNETLIEQQSSEKTKLEKEMVAQQISTDPEQFITIDEEFLTLTMSYTTNNDLDFAVHWRLGWIAEQLHDLSKAYYHFNIVWKNASHKYVNVQSKITQLISKIDRTSPLLSSYDLTQNGIAAMSNNDLFTAAMYFERSLDLEYTQAEKSSCFFLLLQCYIGVATRLDDWLRVESLYKEVRAYFETQYPDNWQSWVLETKELLKFSFELHSQILRENYQLTKEPTTMVESLSAVNDAEIPPNKNTDYSICQLHKIRQLSIVEDELFKQNNTWFFNADPISEYSTTKLVSPLAKSVALFQDVLENWQEINKPIRKLTEERLLKGETKRRYMSSSHDDSMTASTQQDDSSIKFMHKSSKIDPKEELLNTLLNDSNVHPFLKAWTIFQCGEILSKKNRDSEALTYYQRALEMIPHLSEARISLNKYLSKSDTTSNVRIEKERRPNMYKALSVFSLPPAPEELEDVHINAAKPLLMDECLS